MKPSAMIIMLKELTMSYDERLPEGVVETQYLGSGITRYFYRSGESTDVCVTNEPYGVMDFMPTGIESSPYSRYDLS